MANLNSQLGDINKSRMNSSFIQEAIVKDNRDPKKMGRLKVWIMGSSSTEGNKSGWVTCSYASPFAGRSIGTPNAAAFEEHPKSYGFWAVPPDVGTRVFVFFVNGSTEKAYWFGCSYDHGMNSMVPGPLTKVVKDGEVNTPIPVIEFDRNSQTTDPESEYVNVPLIAGLKKQNLLYDLEKGVPNRSSKRQTPAMVYGMSTPRGNHIVFDDGYLDSELNAKTWDDDQETAQNTEYGNIKNDTTLGGRKNEGIVLRTRSGAQIIISESEGYIFLVNRDGTARVEMDKDGKISIMGDSDIAIRSKRDINFFAERDMIIEVLRHLNIKVHGNSTSEYIGRSHTKFSNEVVINAAGSIRTHSNATLRFTADAGLHLESKKDIRAKAANVVGLHGDESVNTTGGGGHLTVKGDVEISDTLKASEVCTPKMSMNSHTHDVPNVAGGSSTIKSIPGTQGAQSPNPEAAPPAETATDVPAEVTPTQVIEDVVSVKADKPTETKVTKDFGKVQESSLSVMGASMPASGTINSSGYWGEKVPQPDGSVISNSGWLLNGSSAVSSIMDGYVVNRTRSTVQINHRNGMQSLYKGISVSNSIQDGSEVKNGTSLGSYAGSMLFEIRSLGASLFGFAGSIDPGLFFEEFTSTGQAAAGKVLTAGTKTSQVANIVVAADGSTKLVTKVGLTTIASAFAYRGSLYSPSTFSRPMPELYNREAILASNEFEQVDVGDPTPIDWVVTENDADLVERLRQDEGTREYQASQGYYRNGRFYVYLDSEGKRTIGYGHLVRSFENFPNGITDQEAEVLFRSDIKSHLNMAKRTAADYGMKIPRTAQLVLTEMHYQLGPGGARQFKTFLTKLTDNDYSGAADQLRSSLWYTQTPNRVQRHINRLKSLN